MYMARHLRVCALLLIASHCEYEHISLSIAHTERVLLGDVHRQIIWRYTYWGRGGEWAITKSGEGTTVMGLSHVKLLTQSC